MLFFAEKNAPVGSISYLRAKMKMSVFENGYFSGHLIFDKNNFWGKKIIILLL